MILDILTYLQSDTTLDTLLGADGSDSKIYPNQARLKVTAPYILYSLTKDGTNEENLLEVAIIFDCVATTYLQCINIRDRLATLLDRQDKIREVITSAGYYYYWCQNVDGEDDVSPKQAHFHKRVEFNLKYAKK